MAQLAMVTMAAGGILNAANSHNQGQLASRSATQAAGQMELGANRYDSSANQEEGAAQRKASEIKRQNKLIQSKATAINAANGGSSADKNFSDLITNMEGEGEYAALTSLFDGSNRANNLRNEAVNLRNKATMTRFEGREARKAGNMGAVTSILGSANKGATFYAKYNNPSPNSTPVNNGASGEDDFDYDSLYS